MKNNKKPQEEIKNYYELKTEAVNDLVDALNQDPTLDVELDKTKTVEKPYKVDFLAKIPTWIKALFVKYWTAGAICYFGFWGLGTYFTDSLDSIVFVGFLAGLVTDLLLNTAFRYFESDKKEYHPFMMIPVSSKKIWPLFLNIIYGILVTVIVAQIYILINYMLVVIKDLPESTISLGVEPLLYGLIFLIVDMFFITFKNLIIKIVKNK
ncbi:MAG: hypothetical protein PHX62_01005 [Bacilli bacterium]|nr:hypothetical protein [Bacilli bacterium]